MLNHAAVVCLSRPRRVLAPGIASLLSLGLGLAFSTSAAALDSIDLSVEAEPTAEGECPRLVQIKYPFLRCANGQIGQSDADETWDDSRRIPLGSGFIEGDGYWGADLNSD
jgi:hypothetical protein